MSTDTRYTIVGTGNIGSALARLSPGPESR